MNSRSMAPILAVFLAVMLLLPEAQAQMGAGGAKQKAPAVKSDLKYIRCSVCEEMVKNIHRDVKQMRDEQGKKFKEIDVIEKVEGMCDPERTAGEWIAHLDMLEDGQKIKLVHHERQAKCDTECRTIARACEDILETSDTDIAEALFKGDMQRAKLQNLLCYDLSDACSTPAPKLPKDRKPGPEFVELDDKALEMQKMMASMKDIPGMPGMSMYSRDDLDDMKGMMDEYGYGDEDGYGYGDDEEGMEGEMGDEDVDPMTKSAGIQGADMIINGVDKAAEMVSDGIGKVAEAASNLGKKSENSKTEEL